jgi:hypothetical protein
MADGFIASASIHIYAGEHLPFPPALAAYRVAQVGLDQQLLTRGT